MQQYIIISKRNVTLDLQMDCNSHNMDGEQPLNNDKGVHQSSPSPMEDMIDNPIAGRSGGPNSAESDSDYLGTCGHCHTNYKVVFQCGKYIYVCSICERDRFSTCPHCGVFRQ